MIALRKMELAGRGRGLGALPFLQTNMPSPLEGDNPAKAEIISPKNGEIGPTSIIAESAGEECAVGLSSWMSYLNARFTELNW